jgi:glycosyltransferase involved in cell wall biosynthesis
LLFAEPFSFDDYGVLLWRNAGGYHPALIAQYGLVSWNHYLIGKDERWREAFLQQARWLVEHEVRIGEGAGGWPVRLPHAEDGNACCLSCVAQGSGLSVLVRAYRLTHEELFLEVARRVVRTFERDILDGGVCSPVGEAGIFFEEVAIYPAAHHLGGFLFALLALYDYVALIGDSAIEKTIEQSLSAMHMLIDEFDTGYWIKTSLLRGQLASPSELALHVTLLDALANCSGCEHCFALAQRWRGYASRAGTRLRSMLARQRIRFARWLLQGIRKLLLPESSAGIKSPMRVCIPITAFPVAGGMRAVLTTIAQVTTGIWQTEYLTQHVGENRDGYAIHRFGSTLTSPRRFPSVWLYSFSGCWKLLSLLRTGPRYDVIMPQDSIFTAVFAALIGRLAGIRVVCIDHGNITAFTSPIYRNERMRAIAAHAFVRRLIERFLLLCYWPSLHLQAWLAARMVDHYFMPGVVGDEMEAACKRLGVQQSRITHFANMVEVDRHASLDTPTRARIREHYGLPAEALVVSIIGRLAPEKGLEVAFEAISRALTEVAPEIRERVRIVVAGDGPLREAVEEDIRGRGLEHACLLPGAASASEVIKLLGITDIFLYTGKRGAGYPMAVLEAMASGCAVIASTTHMVNTRMLADGRGIGVPVGDVGKTYQALLQLLSDPALRRESGERARAYVAEQHSPRMLKRAVMRVVGWSALEQMLHTNDSAVAASANESE